MKKILSAVLAVVMLAMVCLTGCSTPEIAMTVGDKDYTTGEYLAYLSNAYNEIYYNQLYYYMYSGNYTEEQLWDMTFPYGAEDEQVELSLAEYVKRYAQDTIIRQKALEDMMAKYSITISDEDMKEFEKSVEGLTDAAVIDMGYNAKHYRSMALAVSYNESTLFKGLFDVGGKQGTTKEELRKYFEENYFSFKRIEFSLADSEGNKLKDDEIKKIRTTLEGYLKAYEKDKDFDAVIKQYQADEAAKTSTTTTTGTGTTTTTAATTTTTSAATTTTTTATNTTIATGTSTSGSTTTTTDPNLLNIEGANHYSDEDFLKVLKDLKVDEVKIVEYKKNGTTDTIALVLRLDPEKANGKDYYENSHEGILSNAKYEEFNEMVQKVIDGLKVEYSDRAIDMCDPKDLYSSL